MHWRAEQPRYYADENVRFELLVVQSRQSTQPLPARYFSQFSC